jgi:hypothetical protein
MADFFRRLKSSDPRDGLIFFIVLSVVGVILWLGIQPLVIFVEGNRDPSLPMSTPCPVLTASMMPNQYQLEGSWGWHMRTRALAVSGQNTLAADIVVENRCFNGGIGSSFLWVNNQLAAFSRIDREIYDCHGKILWDTKYNGYIEGKIKLKVYDNTTKYIWASNIPDYRRELLIYGQPEDVVAATISAKNLVTIQRADSPAADPRLIIMLYAPADACFAYDFSLLQKQIVTSGTQACGIVLH